MHKSATIAALIIHAFSSAMNQNNPASPVLTVSQLTQAIKAQLESTFPMIHLQGEISNFKRQSSGHLYFSLKDAQSQIGAVMFRGSTSGLQRLPKEGDEVIVKAEISVYAPRGNYQLIVRELTFKGVGELLLQLEQLKRDIHARGWFKQEHKKPLPSMPRRIGIITSPTGAAIRDILNVLQRRHAGLNVILNPVKVQGEGSAEEIAQAIRDFNRYNSVDVMIVGRGGGSIEDLWAFNKEIVAEAIFESQIPIIAAVGHETDHCIAEYVADVRAPTPSAAAEIITQEKAQLQERVDLMQRRLKQTLQHLITQARHRLDGIKRQPVFSSAYALLGPSIQRFDELRDAIDSETAHMLNNYRVALTGFQRQATALNPTAQIRHRKQELLQMQHRLDSNWKQQHQLRKQKFESVTNSLKTINPKNLLSKGYTILLSEKNGSVITSTQALAVDDKIQLLLGDGQASATIQKVESND